MADEGMDPCECIWNHELAMRRLLSLLRQGQAYCTDAECLEQLPGGGGAAAGGVVGGGGGEGDSFVTMFVMMALAVAVYMMMPRRARRAVEAAKPAPHSHDNDGAPPTPPRI